MRKRKRRASSMSSREVSSNREKHKTSNKREAGSSHQPEVDCDKMKKLKSKFPRVNRLQLAASSAAAMVGPSRVSMAESRVVGGAGSKMKNLREFLSSLPILSVGQKHVARFECELDAEQAESSQLIWLKLVRGSESEDGESDSDQEDSNYSKDNTTLISFNRKLITPDKRFRVKFHPPIKWTLSIENVGLDDDNAYYLCQLSAASAHGVQKSQPVSQFVGGGRLNVLVPPVIVEEDTSASLVRANEFEQTSLRCKVTGEPQSQLMWRREDGRSIEGLEMRFKHELERRAHEIISIDSAELLFPSAERRHAGAYLCIASNGVQPGVSQRMRLLVENCRQSSEQNSAREPCDLLQPDVAVQPTTSEPRTVPATEEQQQQQTTKQPTQTQPTRRLPSQLWPTRGNAQIRAPDRRQQTQRLAPGQAADKRRANGARINEVSIRQNSQQPQTATDSAASSAYRTLEPSGVLLLLLLLLLLFAGHSTSLRALELYHIGG